jgi:hypothetical protein
MHEVKRASVHHWGTSVGMAMVSILAGMGLAVAAPSPASSSVWDQLTAHPASISVFVQNPTVGQREVLKAQTSPDGILTDNSHFRGGWSENCSRKSGWAG